MKHSILWKGEFREVELDDQGIAVAAAVFGTNNEPAHDIRRVKDVLAAYTLCIDEFDEVLLEAIAPALKMSLIPPSIRRRIERACDEAEHPKGMSPHTGIARIESSHIRLLLTAIDALERDVPSAGTETVPDGVSIGPEREVHRAGTSSDDARDAARYRWLRAQTWDKSVLCVATEPKDTVRLGTYCPSGDLLDAAIDAAMLRTPHREGSSHG